MNRRTRFRTPSHATIVAYMALFVALGGVSYAAVKLPANSVTSKQIKRGAVKNSDVAKNAVTTAKIKNGSLLSTDFKPGQLVAGAPGATGATGPQGPQGPKGDNGGPGTPADNSVTSATVADDSLTGADIDESSLSGVKIAARAVFSTKDIVQPDGFGNVRANCGPGERAIGGSASYGDGNPDDVRGLQSYPVTLNGVARAWEAAAFNTDVDNSNTGTFELEAHVICTPG